VNPECAVFNKLLVISALGNVALLAAWLARVPDQVGASGPTVTVSGRHPAMPAVGDIARWQALGLDEIEVHRLSFATFEAHELGALANPWERYWEASDPALAYATATSEAYGRIRAQLEQTFGRRAAANPEFARAFRPLAAEAGFLSSAEQLELQRRRLAVRTEQSVRSVDATVPTAAASSIALDFLAPAAALEVQLRTSARAAQLRGSGLDFEEHEFRAAFELLENGDANPDPAAHAALRRELASLLGGSRAAALLATRDPLLSMTRRIAKEHGLAEAQAETAYAALSEAQQQLLELAAARTDGERFATAALAIAEAERTRLTSALGERATDALLMARDSLRGAMPAVPPAANSFE
jgi:hypothetical protein